MSVLNYPLTNGQLELMKLFRTNMSEDELLELKDVLARFYADKATNRANKIWDEKGLTNEDMDLWLKLYADKVMDEADEVRNEKKLTNKEMDQWLNSNHP